MKPPPLCLKVKTGHFIKAKSSLFLTRNRGEKIKRLHSYGEVQPGHDLARTGHSTMIAPRAHDFNSKLKGGMI